MSPSFSSAQMSPCLMTAPDSRQDEREGEIHVQYM